MQLPTLGRVVIAHDPTLAGNNGAADAPAVITRVWDVRPAGDPNAGRACVNLKVLTDGPTDYWWTSVYLYQDPEDVPADVVRYALWPTRT